MLQSDYDKLLSFASLYYRNKVHVDPQDVVNDVVLEILNSDKEIFIDDVIDRIKRHKSLYENTITTMGHDFSKSDTQRVCKDCKELLPVGAFYILKQKTKLAIASYCKKCQGKRSLKYYHKDSNKKNARAYQNEYLKKYWQRNKNKINAKRNAERKANKTSG